MTLITRASCTKVENRSDGDFTGDMFADMQVNIVLLALCVLVLAVCVCCCGCGALAYRHYLLTSQVVEIRKHTYDKVHIISSAVNSNYLSKTKGEANVVYHLRKECETIADPASLRTVEFRRCKRCELNAGIQAMHCMKTD